MSKVTATVIFNSMADYVGQAIPVPKEKWLDAAFALDVCRLEEAKLYNEMAQKVAQKKLEIFKAQEKRNVAAVEMEVEASDEYRFMKDQEALIYSIDEMIRIGKKNSDINL